MTVALSVERISGTVISASTVIDDWKSRRRRFAHRGFVVCCATLLVVSAAAYQSEVGFIELWNGLPHIAEYLTETVPRISVATASTDVSEWFWNTREWLRLLADTVLIAIVSTVLATMLALSICFPAVRLLSRNVLAYHAARRLIDLARAIPTIVLALVFVYAFGVGPLAGVLAITIHTAGVLGKLFADNAENVQIGPIDGVVASGGNWFQVVRFAVVPQVLPTMISFVLLRFESNVRAASILGFIGAGGIGQELMFAIRQFQFTDMSAVVILLVATVFIIDLGTQFARRRILEGVK